MSIIYFHYLDKVLIVFEILANKKKMNLKLIHIQIFK